MVDAGAIERVVPWQHLEATDLILKWNGDAPWPKAVKSGSALVPRIVCDG